ncbi:MAG: hypothetical protein JSW08_02225 [archaeon]|nr:MAG: hypothetical protein JSW08_02225 [archaeon]
MAKKLTIIFGGSVDFYHSYLWIFGRMEKRNKWKFRRVEPEKFISKINGIDVEVFFCLNPIQDKNYDNLKEWLETGFKNIMPLPTDQLIKKIKPKNPVLFLGLCGAFKGKKYDIHIPEEFSEVFFKGETINHKHVLKVKPKNRIKIKNVLSKKIKGKPGRMVTSNLTLAPANIHRKSKSTLVKLAEVLSQHGECVDKETYQIAKHLGKKVPLGIFLVVSDVLSIKKHMLDVIRFKVDANKLSKHFTNAIKTMVKLIK